MAEKSIPDRIDECEIIQGNLQTELYQHRTQIKELRDDLRTTLEVLQYFFGREQVAFRDAKLDEQKKTLVANLIEKYKHS